MLHYDPKLKQRSRELRNRSTLAEVAALEPVEEKQNARLPVLETTTYSQVHCGFLLPRLKLVIEIDGESH
jgi:very-short-patch-repair endonuclease